MSDTQKIFQDSIPWVRLAICTNNHIKSALLKVLHNEINHPQVTGIPSDPNDLYLFLQTNKNRIKSSKHIKKGQKSILLPTSSQKVDSSLFDISLIRWLIQNFSQITNANGNWQEPLPTDQTICANVFRAAEMRNRIFHYDNVGTLDEATFEIMWNEMKDILKGLNYTGDIEPMRKEVLDVTKLQGEMLQEFRGYLEDYKKEMSNRPRDFYIERRFSVDNDENSIVNEINEIIAENDRVNICGDAGIGKSVTARHIKYEWCKEEILEDSYLLYFDSKRINQRIQYHSLAAPLFFSELGDFLREEGKTENDFLYYNFVRTTLDDLIILIDGIDEFPIKDLVTQDYVSELERKVLNNEKISAIETITAIYFGFFFPSSKVCLFGRKGEFERLKNVNVNYRSSIFNKVNRKIKNLELLKFDETNVKDFTCDKLCKQQQNGQRICIGACEKVYEEIKCIEVCKISTDLNLLIELYKKHPNKNIGRITRTKLIIATLLNRLNEHITQNNFFTLKTFRKISEKEEHFGKYLECIRILGEISFQTLLEGNATVEVKEERGHFKFNDEIRVERKILEELDFFYVHDFDYYLILEPHHTLNIEFLSACYLFSHPDKWDSMLKLNDDRQIVIISFISGLFADDYFTKDFVENVLKAFDNSLKMFFSWLYNVEDVRRNLPNGGFGFNRWYGLMETQKLSPSFYLLNSIYNEVEIPRNFHPKIIICYCGYYSVSSSKWYNMEYFKHSFLTKVSDKLNIKLFLKKFIRYNFIIKGRIEIYNNDEFNLLNELGSNNLLTFKIDILQISTSLNTSFSSYFNINSIYIEENCDSRTIDMILNAISPSNLFNSPTIKCKHLFILDIASLNGRQTENLFRISLTGVVGSIYLYYTFFTEEQIIILKYVERKNKNRMINIKLFNVNFSCVFDLPKLRNRHISLYNVNNVTDNDLIEFVKNISPGSSNNLNNYKIINNEVPFVRKKNCAREGEQSMYLNLYRVDLTQVTPDVFANTFSLTPTLSCWDDDRYIPSLHWLRLSQVENCRINELRIWLPQSKNYEHFLNIRTTLLQFVFVKKDHLKQLLNHIVRNSNVNLNKEMKVFIVKYDYHDWDYYEEIPLFMKKTVGQYKDNYISDDLLLDELCLPFFEGEKHLKYWCCEIFS